MATEEQNAGAQSSLPSSPTPRQTFHLSPGFVTGGGTRASPTSALPSLGTARRGAVTSRHGFGVIRPLLIQLQKFGKHFVNNPRPGTVMLSRSGDFCSPDAVLFNAGNLRTLCSRDKPSPVCRGGGGRGGRSSARFLSDFSKVTKSICGLERK